MYLCNELFRDTGTRIRLFGPGRLQPSLVLVGRTIDEMSCAYIRLVDPVALWEFS